MNAELHCPPRKKRVHPALICTAAAVLWAGCVPGPHDRAAKDNHSSVPLLAAGDAVPDYRFTDQTGREFALGDLRPRWVLATFIFSRCGVRDFCPRVNAKFVEIRDALEASAAPPDLMLLSISLDPDFDTPEQLAAFAAAYEARVDDWIFATCPPDTLAAAMRSFGVWARPNPDTVLDHNLRTALIAPDGRLAAVWEGNRWTYDQVLATAAAFAEESSPVVDAAGEQAVTSGANQNPHSKPDPIP